MFRLLLRWGITALAIAAAAYLIPGITVSGDGLTVVLVMAVILGFVNATVRPLLVFLSCPLVILTLGLMLPIINGVTLWLASWLAQQFGIGFVVADFWSGFFGALVISIVSGVLSIFVPDDRERRHKNNS